MTRRGLFASVGAAVAAATVGKFKHSNIHMLHVTGTDNYTLAMPSIRPKRMFVKQVWPDGSVSCAWVELPQKQHEIKIFPAVPRLILTQA